LGFDRYRLGTYIPLPGISSRPSRRNFHGKQQGVLELFNMFAGAVQGMAIFALNIMPYISASIIVQLMSSVIPLSSRSRRRANKAEGHHQYTRYLTVVIAASRPMALRWASRDNPM